MFTKAIPLQFNNNFYVLSYQKEFIDESEIQFCVINVKTETGEIDWDHQLIIHYYLNRNKIETTYFEDRTLNEYKSTIVKAILKNERVS